MLKHRKECQLRVVTCEENCGIVMCARDQPAHSCIAFYKQCVIEITKLKAENETLKMN